MSEWFVRQAETAIGPLSPTELLVLVRGGSVRHDTLIRRNDSKIWTTAGSVGGLFEAAMRPTILNYCPECDALLETTPCECPNCHHHVEEPRTRIIENTIADRDLGS
jgi:hypothetical protein